MTGLRRLISEIPAQDHRRRFDTAVSRLGWRIDAEPQAPIYDTYRRAIAQSDVGRRLGDIADIRKPYGRNRIYYVASPEFGLPFLSGRQIAQYRPIGLKYVSLLTLDDPDEYKLKGGWLVMTADGRAEEHLADCSVVTGDRIGWAASGHVHRIVPKEGGNAGVLYLACTAQVVQAQVKARATGSVVDALSDNDASNVLVPFPESSEAREMGNRVLEAWGGFSEASRLEAEAVAALEEELAT